MKNEIYITIALFCTIIAFLACFKYYIETRYYIAPLVGHRVDTEATILRPGFNGLNERGEDSSCVVEYVKDGRVRTAERWNIGNCDYHRKFMTDYLSYQF